MFTLSTVPDRLHFGGLYVVDTINRTDEKRSPQEIVHGFLRQETNAIPNQSHFSFGQGFANFNQRTAKGGWILNDEMAEQVTDEKDKIVFLTDDKDPDATEFGVTRNGDDKAQKNYLQENKKRAKRGIVTYGMPIDLPSESITLEGKPRLASMVMEQPIYSLVLDILG